MLAFYSDDPSSNPAEAYSFPVKFVFGKNKKKENWVGSFFKNTQAYHLEASQSLCNKSVFGHILMQDFHCSMN